MARLLPVFGRSRTAPRAGGPIRWPVWPLALCLAFPAHAWGPLGHRLIAHLAEDGLTPQARAEADRLLHGEPADGLAAIANWADELREHDPHLGRRSARWHYVNIAEHDCGYRAARDCPGGDCLIGALDAQARILADAGRSDPERLQALKFVVHLAGDAHQPLHAGYGHDRGGNTHQLNHRGRGTNLHAFWDSGLLNAHRRDEAAWLERLRALPAPDATLPQEPALEWAKRSCRIVLEPGFYPSGHVVGEEYVRLHLPAAERQLRLAGAHLAALLNATLAPR